jgi:hypothetical protein
MPSGTGSEATPRCRQCGGETVFFNFASKALSAERINVFRCRTCDSLTWQTIMAWDGDAPPVLQQQQPQPKPEE